MKLKKFKLVMFIFVLCSNLLIACDGNKTSEKNVDDIKVKEDVSQENENIHSMYEFLLESEEEFYTSRRLLETKLRDLTEEEKRKFIDACMYKILVRDHRYKYVGEDMAKKLDDITKAYPDITVQDLNKEIYDAEMQMIVDKYMFDNNLTGDDSSRERWIAYDYSMKILSPEEVKNGHILKWHSSCIESKKGETLPGELPFEDKYPTIEELDMIFKEDMKQPMILIYDDKTYNTRDAYEKLMQFKEKTEESNENKNIKKVEPYYVNINSEYFKETLLPLLEKKYKDDEYTSWFVLRLPAIIEVSRNQNRDTGDMEYYFSEKHNLN